MLVSARHEKKYGAVLPGRCRPNARGNMGQCCPGRCRPNARGNMGLCCPGWCRPNARGNMGQCCPGRCRPNARGNVGQCCPGQHRPQRGSHQGSKTHPASIGPNAGVFRAVRPTWPVSAPTWESSGQYDPPGQYRPQCGSL